MSGRTATLLLRSPLPALPAGVPRLRREAVAAPPPERRLVVSYALSMASVCLLVFFLNLLVLGQVHHYAAQKRLYGEFRETLAAGSVPIGQTDVTGELTALGTPVAQLSIPELGVREIVVEGTTSWQTMQGVGHRRDTPMPGQAGVSVLMGRHSAYGGVFGHLGDLRAGSTFSVTTGQGVADYRVIGVRDGTTTLPVLGPEDGRLTLVTAAGSAYRPDGALRVDAELVSPAFPRPSAVLPPGDVLDSEQVLAGDRSHAFALSWMLELLVLVVVAALWSWRRWTRPATWLVFLPILAVTGLAISASLTAMLPNVL